MERTTVYKADDGALFESEVACLIYEHLAKVAEVNTALVCIGDDLVSRYALAEFLANNVPLVKT